MIYGGKGRLDAGERRKLEGPLVWLFDYIAARQRQPKIHNNNKMAL
jgi:hypothetical protein